MSETPEKYITRTERYIQHIEEEQSIMLSRHFIRCTIQALLNQVDQWERLLDISPRTAEIRKIHKKNHS